MEVKFVEKESFAVIGREGQGLKCSSMKWIHVLWKNANESLGQIIKFAKLDNNGQIAGFWGAMTDLDHKYLPWQDSGKYLAGCEVEDDAIPPNGWTKWIIPGYKYLVVRVDLSTYEYMMNYITKDYIPTKGYELVGSPQEYYAPNFSNQEIDLYFPIKKL